jgi:hypothetical protein
MKTFRKLPLALALALALPAVADEGPRFAGFATFAGSDSNLRNLVAGLRNDTPITLTATSGSGTPQSVTFDPPTKPLGFGNVRHALTLSRAELRAAGIANPTPQQIEAAMMGGTVTTADGKTVTLQGVLQLRSQGMGWGQIRRTLNLPPTSFAQGGRAGAGMTTALGGSPRVVRAQARGAESELRGRADETGDEARGHANEAAPEHRGDVRVPVAATPPQASAGIVTAAGTPAGAVIRTGSGQSGGSGHGRGGR